MGCTYLHCTSRKHLHRLLKEVVYLAQYPHLIQWKKNQFSQLFNYSNYPHNILFISLTRINTKKKKKGNNFQSSNNSSKQDAVVWLLHGKSKSSFGAHSRAEFTTAKAAAPSATVNPMTARRMMRRAVGCTTATLPRCASRARCCCCCSSFRLCRSTVSGRCCVDASSKSLKVETAVLDKRRQWFVVHVCCEGNIPSEGDRLTADCALWPAQTEGTGRTGLRRG